VALNLRWLLRYVERFCGRRFAWLNAIGGGAESEVWCQILADALDRPIRQMAEPIRANARGAALLGAVGMGWIGFEDIAGLVPSARTFRPDPERRALYDRSFDAFQRLHAANRGLFHRLNR
jgi:xylulokinase